MFAGELRKQKAVFAVADGVALFAAFGLAISLHRAHDEIEASLLRGGPVMTVLGGLLLLGSWLLLFRAFDLYRLRSGGLDELAAVLKACAGAWLLALVLGFYAHLELRRLTLGLALVFAVSFVLAARALVRAIIRRLYADPKIAIPLVIVGFNPLAHYLCDQIVEETTQYEMVGFLDHGVAGREYRGFPALGGIEKLAELKQLCPGLEVAIALPDASADTHREIVEACDRLRIRWRTVPSLFRHAPTGLRIDQIGIVPLVGPRSSNIEGLNFAVKRAFDLVVALGLLLLTGPVMLVAALLIWITDGRPVLFRQTRIGIRGQPFEMLKLRTMRHGIDDQVHREYVREWICRNRGASENGEGQEIFKLTSDPRITRIGKILRRLSLDELPQLFNVLKGEMSLVGPRPALPYEAALYNDWHRKRFEALPGITGLWQTSGRNRLSFDDMVRLDIQYIEDWSLGTDLRIIAQTVPAMLHGDGR